jgi:hypothetical protein
LTKDEGMAKGENDDIEVMNKGRDEQRDSPDSAVGTHKKGLWLKWLVL